jgi:hypothetical protein
MNLGNIGKTVTDTMNTAKNRVASIAAAANAAKVNAPDKPKVVTAPAQSFTVNNTDSSGTDQNTIDTKLDTNYKPIDYNKVDLNAEMTMPDVRIGGKNAYDYSREAAQSEGEKQKQLRMEALQGKLKSQGIGGAAAEKLGQISANEIDTTVQQQLNGQRLKHL